MNGSVTRAFAFTCVASIVVNAGCSKEIASKKTAEVRDFRSPERPKDFVRDLEKLDLVNKSLGPLFSKYIVVPIRKRDFSNLSEFTASDFAARFIPVSKPNLSASSTVAVRRLSSETEVLDSKAFQARLEELLIPLSIVEQASFRTFEVLFDQGLRKAFVQSHWDFAGMDAEKRRHRWNLTAQVELHKTENGRWQMTSLDLSKAVYVVSRGVDFQDVSGFTGLQLRETKENKKHAQALVDLRQLTQSGGINIVDVNQDDYWDVLVTRKDRAAGLYINDGVGGFNRAKFAPLEDTRDLARFYLNVDLDNDGQNEWVNTKVTHTKRGQASLGMITFKAGKPKLHKMKLPFRIPVGIRDLSFEGLTACDVNGDQLLDLVVVGYSHWESLRDKFNLVDGRDGLRNLLFINQGGLRFKEESIKRGISGTQYSFVSECVDFDSDGDVDIFVGNDYGQNVYYENDGTGHFREDPNHPFSRAHGFSMGIARADYDNRGSYAVSISNMYSHAGHRIVPLVKGLSSKMHEVVQNYARGNALYELKDGKYVDMAQERGVELAEWAWGNIFFDIDNDADKDLYVVNGFTTHQDANAPDW